MKLLEFAMPTWKRPKQLLTSASSILDQGGHLVISHHLCDVETLPVIEELKKKYPTLRAVACELGEHPDYSDSFKQVFGLTESKWTWTFGDDDCLVPGAIACITPILERDEFEFIHVAEAVRSSNGGGLIKGKLLDLCNAIGWIEMTGFISSNIVKTDKLNEAVHLKSWDLYAKNAFVQCCALFEVLNDRDSAFYDYALVDSKILEDADQTAIRWGETNTGLRYHYVDDALLNMRERGIIKTDLSPKFFRYHCYHLWDRFLTHLVNSYNTDQDFQITDYLEDLIKRCRNLVSFLGPEDKKRYNDEISEIRQSLVEHCDALHYAISKAEYMSKLVEDHGRSRYDFSYLPPQMGKK